MMAMVGMAIDEEKKSTAEPVRDSSDRVLHPGFGTEAVPVEQINEAVLRTFDLLPAAIIRDPNLLCPIYSQVPDFGHLGREFDMLTWKRIDHTDALANAVRD